ncbi:RNA polymerase subunit sigma-24 [Rhodanobacter sp. Root480]|uniref:RNA polymerase sigma factor n=1 Tax=Rhodanobacter sp. Root480 TaxID=1736542 RepID=UPI0006F9E2A0|nr:RNA polymerase sigma factor [Rhodanobacter sp. Root480]KQY00673.1 RNA polymerase subunit sigma-24 [Rhodanobacter sp. Root480]
MASTHPDAIHRALDTLWRMESPRLLARIARMTGNIDTAEELAQDVLLGALERWPRDGLPDNPAAWLMTAARHRAIDHLRQRALHARKHDAFGIERELHGADMQGDEAPDKADDDIGDDLLRLLFVACHPVLPMESRVALTLRLLGGLSTPEIARAFLQAEPTVAQRIVRAKRKLSKEAVAFEIPRKAELPERLDAVLEVLYLVFNEGYAATGGEDWMRPALCEEALRLGRVLVGLLPDQAEVFGLLALMELQASRIPARTEADGTPILLPEQNRARWDRLQIQRGLAALERAQRLGGAGGAYALQAAIAACHARALRMEDTDWPRIEGLYAQLVQVMPSPVVELNRAVAVSRARGAAAGLTIVDALEDAGQLRDYAPLPAVRGDLLRQLGRLDEARNAFKLAASLTANARERAVLLARAQACDEPGGPR